MFCHNCGTKGMETAAFCGKCGTKFRKVKDDVVKTDIQNIPPKPDKVRKDVVKLDGQKRQPKPDRLRVDDTRSERIKELDRKKRPTKPDKVRTDDIRSGFWKDRHKKKTKQNDYDKIRREQDKHFEQSHNKTWEKKKPFSKPNDNNRSSKPSNRNTKSKPFPIASLIILGMLLLGGAYLYSGLNQESMSNESMSNESMSNESMSNEPVSNEPVSNELKDIPSGKEPVDGKLCVHHTFSYKREVSYCDWLDAGFYAQSPNVNTMKMQMYALEYLNQRRNSPCPGDIEFINDFNGIRGRSDCDPRSILVMSDIDSAQSKSDNIVSVCGAPSHWDTNGLKPHVTYTFLGGQGFIGENIGGKGRLDEKKNEVFYWSEENIQALIRENIDGMLYHDSHADWGHRDSLLERTYNKASFGISVTESCASIVIHMERDYIEWNQFPTIVESGGAKQIMFSGTIDQNSITKMNEEKLKEIIYLAYESDFRNGENSWIIELIKNDETPLSYGFRASCTILRCGETINPQESREIWGERVGGRFVPRVEVNDPCLDKNGACIFPPSNEGWSWALDGLNAYEADKNDWVINCDGVKCSFSISIDIRKDHTGIITIVFTDFMLLTLDLG